MKRLNKQLSFSKEELDQLNLIEQKYLFGGYYGGGDIENRNTQSGCRCTYNNHGVVTNTNETGSCNCDCV